MAAADIEHSNRMKLFAALAWIGVALLYPMFSLRAFLIASTIPSPDEVWHRQLLCMGLWLILRFCGIVAVHKYHYIDWQRLPAIVPALTFASSITIIAWSLFANMVYVVGPMQGNDNERFSALGPFLVILLAPVLVVEATLIGITLRPPGVKFVVASVALGGVLGFLGFLVLHAAWASGLAPW